VSFFGRLRPYLIRDIIVLLLLGMASGLPYLLVFGTLSMWLVEAGIERATIGFLSWSLLAYSFKFIWAPLIDSLPIPWLTKRLGRRRSWLLIAQSMIIVALLLMAATDPIDKQQLMVLTIGAVLLAFASATQDIVIDAYRIELATPEFQTLFASTTVSGYRIGMVLASAGALEISNAFDAGGYTALGWQIAYSIMAVVVGLAMLLTLNIREPQVNNLQHYSNNHHMAVVLHFILMVATFITVFINYKRWVILPNFSWSAGSLSLLGFGYEMLGLLVALTCAALAGLLLLQTGMVDQGNFKRMYTQPFTDFFKRYGQFALWLLALICFYRISDIVMGKMAKVFYSEMGYSKVIIGRVSFGFGIVVSLTGGVLGGVLAYHFGILRILLLGAILSSASNLAFVMLANLAVPSTTALSLTIVVDNLSGGLATAAAVAFLSSLVNREFSATQYAAFTSVTQLLPSLIAGYSGQIIDAIDYSAFFVLTAAMGIPVVFLIFKIWKNYQCLLATK
jgi:MFS transporter, PAT family, beta-lactamase induction signal transducer AmpG